MTDLASVKAIFSAPTPKLVLATYRSAVGEEASATDAVNAIKDKIKALAKQHKIELCEWTLPLAPKNGTPTTSPSAQIFQQLVGVANLHTATPAVVPALLAVNKGELCDVLKGLDELRTTAPEFITRFANHLASAAASKKKGQQQTPQEKLGLFQVDQKADSATVDVAKLVKMGQELMQKGQAVYAEKFFEKALGVMDAVSGQIDASEGMDHDLEGSIATTLAWLCMAQLVQEKGAPIADESSEQQQQQPKKTATQSGTIHRAHTNAACDRIEKDFVAWITPLSECSRAVALRNLARYLPLGAEWDGLNCSAKKLTAELLEISAAATAEKAAAKKAEEEADATAAKAQKLSEEGSSASAVEKKSTTPLSDRVTVLRALLIITYFLQGDLERAITEAIKLHVMKIEYGTIAMDTMVRFLGDDHSLVARSGWLVIKQAGI